MNLARTLSPIRFALLLLGGAVVAAPDAGAQQPLFTFVQVSDSQPTGSDDQMAFESVLQVIADSGNSGALLPYPVDFLVFAGDLVNRGSNDSEWRSFVDTMDTWLTSNGIAYRATPGNHDRGSDFSEYDQHIGPNESWSMGSAPFVGHNGLQIPTGWEGLRFIGMNNTNGGNNRISSSDLSNIETYVAAAEANNENVFFLGHHPHNESSRKPLGDMLESSAVNGYMRGHTSGPAATKGLSGVSNSNVWETKTNSIYSREALIYFQVYQTDIEAYVLEVDSDNSLPSPKIIELIHALRPAGGGPTTTMAPTTTTTLAPVTTTTLPACAAADSPDCDGTCSGGLGCLDFGGFCACGTTTTTTTSTTTTTLSPTGAAELREIQTGSSTSTNTVSTSSSITAAFDDLYLASVASKKYEQVLGVSGLGLTWSQVATQCAGRSQAGVTIWSAQGMPGSSGVVSATFADSVSSAAIAVSRYRGARMPMPLETVASANTNGVGGGCSGGSDNAAYAFPLETSADNSVVHLAVSMRKRSHFPGGGFVEHGSVLASGGGGPASLSISDRQIGMASIVNVTGSFDSSVDWSVVAVEIIARDLEPCMSALDCDDLEPCTDDACESDGTCSHTDNSASCDDGVFCNGADTCSGGSCSANAGDPCSLGLECADLCNESARSCDVPAGTACTDDGNVCTDDACDGSGSCAHPSNSAPCDDGTFCNGADTCSSGSCSQHAGDPCSGGGECAGSCDEGAGTCGVAAGTPCSDDGNACTDDECDGSGSCAHPPNTESCDDDVYCNGDDTCSGGSCSEHAGDPCAGGGECADVCDETAESCDAPSGSPCTDDGNPCTDDRCDAGGSCKHTNNTAPCADGDPCNGDEVCGGGSCGSDTPRDCDDGDACTADTCTTGVGCQYTNLCGADEIALEQVVSGGSSDSTTVSTSGPVGAASDQLYLAAITSKKFTAVTTVEGLGIAWSPVGAQCAGRSQTGSTLWMAYGSPAAGGVVSATLADAASNAAILVARYSGVDGADPVGAVASANTNGVSGSCANGSDADTYAFGLTTEGAGSVVCVIPAMRSREHLPGAGFTHRASANQGVSGGSIVSVALADMLVDDSGGVSIGGSFDGSVDWAVVAVELRAGAGGSPPCGSNADCGDGNSCTDDVCSGGVCSNPANSESCDDGLYCNGDDTCSGGSCSAHAGDPCTGGGECSASCNESSNACEAATGAPCTDDGNACTDDVCDSGGTCTHPNNSAPCPDGDLCNGDEMCAGGSCQAGTALDCDDSDACTDDSCSATSGCQHANVCGGADIVLEDLVTGGSAGATTVSTDAAIAAVPGDLYLASITSKKQVNVISVSGLGLTWTRAAAQCSGRSQTGMEVWIAQGTPSAAGVVTASLSRDASNAAIVVSRYSGVDSGDPIGAIGSANTNGAGGGCSGGSDSNAYSFGLTTTGSGSVVFVSPAMRNRSHEPGAAYTERVEHVQGSGGSAASVAVADATAENPGAVTVDGGLGGKTDWAVVALELLAAPAGGP